jgi:thiamine biosynthesis protein ThiS
MRKIEIHVNGDRREIDDGLTVGALLDRLGVPAAGAIVERNREVVQRSRFGEDVVCAGDRIEIVRLMGGG